MQCRAEGGASSDSMELQVAELEDRYRRQDLALLQQFAADEFVDWQGQRIMARYRGRRRRMAPGVARQCWGSPGARRAFGLRGCVGSQGKLASRHCGCCPVMGMLSGEQFAGVQRCLTGDWERACVRPSPMACSASGGSKQVSSSLPA